MVFKVAASPSYSEDGRLAAACSDGIRLSQDGGQSWALVCPSPQPVTAVSWLGPGGLVASVGSKVLATSDGGVSWKDYPPVAADTIVTAIASWERVGQPLVVVATAHEGVYWTEDLGSWTPRNFGLLDWRVLSLEVCVQDERVLFLAGTEGGGVFVAGLEGPWRCAAAWPCAGAVLCLAAGPDGGPPPLLAGTEAGWLWASTDGGHSWRAVPLPPGGGPINACTLGPGGRCLLVARGTQLLVSGDSGDSWDVLGEWGDERFVTALCAPSGLRPGAPILCGLSTGEIDITYL
ncbi:hypothetical protein Tter_2469 [Thermobaculum terrenum ATCC BAA-798]|uniref:Photosynthesis system II assembly factor Ycf48/Hcf136-like domain-containing protein n=1 Tax=Thermobaculum terrenum (strain ATCC BAA-798 / CCMEE 7001 / YNP1) TaxID=525904 RepID=D1CHZ1_THET1|nr:hypothetical protein Tter_2469 [Thermobaculum terrenum ATCC BAA-798]